MDGTCMYNCPTFFLFWKCLDDMSYWTNLYRTVADNELHFFTISNLNYQVYSFCEPCPSAYRNQLRFKIHCSTAIRPRYRLVFLREIERNIRNYVQLGELGHLGSVTNCARKKKSDFVQKAGNLHDLAGRGTFGKKAGLSRQKRDGWQV